MMLKVSLEGEKALKDRLLKMSASVQGAVMRPVVADAAMKVRDLARTLAPKRTGRLQLGIITREMKVGYGYCQWKVTLNDEAYYGVFHEYGLGTGRLGGPSKIRERRAGNYAESTRIRKFLKNAQQSKGLTWDETLRRYGFVHGSERMGSKGVLKRDKASGKLRREGKRQNALEQGRYLQGKRQPNMAAHPFLRPAVKFLRTAVRDGMVVKLWAEVQRWSVPDNKVGA